tara:strand:- start:6000 stop:6182 length:183 start_codon:yes stop_codon:yes gene_type:complete
MNYKEDLTLKLQNVKLAIAEVNECNYESEKQRNLKILALKKIESAIINKGKMLEIDLKVA